jgi:alanine-glyoxylate transaminase/serine-glyoxylate transaminase/serine-pyruvate transaminase
MPGERILLGPGPSLLPPAVNAALSDPLIGHVDPDLFPILEDAVQLLRQVFQTKNELTIPLSGTGTAGMEAAILHMVRPGETLVVGTAGFFADRIAEIGHRVGAEIVRVEAPWGRPLDPSDVDRTLSNLRGRPACVAVVHVETSTGVVHPVADIANVAHARSVPILVDAVASLGGAELPVDAWDLDACYGGSQKCLSAPPGMAPITVHQRTRGRHAPATFYLDLESLWTYWGPGHAYHHTVPVNLLYAMRAALQIVIAEGIAARVERHWRNTRALWRGLDALGLELLVEEAHRSPTITTVRAPDGVDDAKVRTRLLREYGIEISGGLGPLRGKIWRVGLMGHSSQPKSVLLLLGALEAILASEGVRVPRGVAAAQAAATL